MPNSDLLMWNTSAYNEFVIVSSQLPGFEVQMWIFFLDVIFTSPFEYVLHNFVCTSFKEIISFSLKVHESSKYTVKDQCERSAKQPVKHNYF